MGVYDKNVFTNFRIIYIQVSLLFKDMVWYIYNFIGQQFLLLIICFIIIRQNFFLISFSSKIFLSADIFVVYTGIYVRDVFAWK
jgi:hypothetical protein